MCYTIHPNTPIKVSNHEQTSSKCQHTITTVTGPPHAEGKIMCLKTTPWHRANLQLQSLCPATPTPAQTSTRPPCGTPERRSLSLMITRYAPDTNLNPTHNATTTANLLKSPYIVPHQTDPTTTTNARGIPDHHGAPLKTLPGATGQDKHSPPHIQRPIGDMGYNTITSSSASSTIYDQCLTIRQRSSRSTNFSATQRLGEHL